MSVRTFQSPRCPPFRPLLTPAARAGGPSWRQLPEDPDDDDDDDAETRWTSPKFPHGAHVIPESGRPDSRSASYARPDL